MPSADSSISDELVSQYKENGYAVVRNFLSEEEVEELKEAIRGIIKTHCLEAPVVTYKHGQDIDHVTESRNLFKESEDSIIGFYEETAVKDGDQVVVAKDKALNKIGHAVHGHDETVRKFTVNAKVKAIVDKFTAMKKATVVQSMFIFKHPKVGSEVSEHQDSTYLYAEPPQNSLIGFWIALDEATEENGCLHFIPGSHLDGKVYQRFKVNPDKDSKQLYVYTGEKLPFEKEKLVAAPAKPGDLLLLDGLVTHYSASNSSNKSRTAYTFHIADLEREWSPENWLQPTAKNTFVPLE